VEHYEIAGYGSARTHAQLLGHDKIASLLEKTLGEEKEADTKLNDLAQTTVNEEAASVNEEGVQTHPAPAKTRSAGSTTKH
jgi:ferritin-like metal-binding protein YciE